jgi:nucleoside-diphosphate-sugar epimerase
VRALVTGASGFIGSALVEELGTLGFEVDALMRKTSSGANLAGLRYRRVEGDLTDEASLRRAVRDVDYVFHLAGLTAARSSAEFFAYNTEGTARLARAVAEARPSLSRFVYVSSLAASGPASARDKPMSELETEHPVSAYGQSKLAAERELLRYRECYPISIVRPPMVYGPRDKGVFVVIQTVARNLMPILQGSSEGGDKFYSIIHVRDLVRGIVQSAVASVAKVPSGEVFFLASDQTPSYQEILSTIAEALGRDPLRIRVPKPVIRALAVVFSSVGTLTRRTFPLNLDKLNELLPDYWVCSNSKAKIMLGFVPEIDLASGMASAIEWYQRHRWI